MTHPAPNRPAGPALPLAMRHHRWMMPRGWTESEAGRRFIEAVESAGGRWEIAETGALHVHAPVGGAFDAEAAMTREIEMDPSLSPRRERRAIRVLAGFFGLLCCGAGVLTFVTEGGAGLGVSAPLATGALFLYAAVRGHAPLWMLGWPALYRPRKPHDDDDPGRGPR